MTDFWEYIKSRDMFTVKQIIYGVNYEFSAVLKEKHGSIQRWWCIYRTYAPSTLILGRGYDNFTEGHYTIDVDSKTLIEHTSRVGRRWGCSQPLLTTMLKKFFTGVTFNTFIPSLSDMVFEKLYPCTPKKGYIFIPPLQ